MTARRLDRFQCSYVRIRCALLVRWLLAVALPLGRGSGLVAARCVASGSYTTGRTLIRPRSPRVSGSMPVPPVTSPMIRFDRLTKCYGRLAAVRDLSLEVLGGEVYALLGPNGAGKTTAIRCLASLVSPTSGSTWVAGTCSQDDPVEARRKLALLTASMGLYERLTAVELIEYFGRLHGLDGDRLDERVRAVVGLFGIEPFGNRLCGRLSTGQRQRVSLARALVHDPPALILDEPTTGLDVLSGQTIYEFIDRERARGKAILFSTHQMEEVDLLADRVGVLRDGSLVAEGPPATVVAATGEASLARAFLSLVRDAEVQES